jgi:DNA-binding NtrC family response regulator
LSDQSLIELPSHEKAIIEAALRESGGDGRDGAASKLGMPRSTPEPKITSLKIDKNRFQSAYPSTPGN